MKKIGILVNSIGYGGNERSAVNIAKAIADQYDVSIIIQEDCGNHYGYEGRVINLDTPCAESRLGKAMNSIRRIQRLKKIIKQEYLETLFIILPVSNPINYLRFSCKKIVSCRDCGDLMKRTDKYIKMTECSDLMVCNSEDQTKYLSNAAPQLKDKIRMIYNILDIDKIIRLKDEEPDPDVAHFLEGHRFIITTSRFAKAKGLNNLLKAFALLEKNDDDLRLLMIGDGDRKEQIEKLISELEIKDKVLLPGFQDNPFKYIARANAYILPSFYEGFPNTLIESMACGTPVIAADCPSGPAEILCGRVEQGFKVAEYGVLVAAFDEQKSNWDYKDIKDEHVNLANAIETVINDQKLSDTLTAKSGDRIRDFTSEKIAVEWEKML